MKMVEWIYLYPTITTDLSILFMSSSEGVLMMGNDYDCSPTYEC